MLRTEDARLLSLLCDMICFITCNKLNMNMVLTCEHVLITKYNNRKGLSTFWQLGPNVPSPYKATLYTLTTSFWPWSCFKYVNKGYRVDPQVSYFVTRCFYGPILYVILGNTYDGLVVTMHKRWPQNRNHFCI